VRVGHVAEAVAQQEVILSIESKKKKYGFRYLDSKVLFEDYTIYLWPICFALLPFMTNVSSLHILKITHF